MRSIKFELECGQDRHTWILRVELVDYSLAIVWVGSVIPRIAGGGAWSTTLCYVTQSIKLLKLVSKSTVAIVECGRADSLLHGEIY